MSAHEPHFFWQVTNPWTQRLYTTTWRMTARDALAISDEAEPVGLPVYRKSQADSPRVQQLEREVFSALLLASMRTEAALERRVSLRRGSRRLMRSESMVTVGLDTDFAHAVALQDRVKHLMDELLRQAAADSST